MGIRIAITIGVAFLAQRALFLLVNRAQKWLVRAGHGSQQTAQRAGTIGQAVKHLITVLVSAGALFHILAILGWNVQPLLVGAGLVGVALGLGAQTLVRDVIAGTFILVENQFSVGDLIEANGRAATVESVTLRCTTLRDFNGFVHFVPNGEMKTVVNRSRGWNRVAVDVPIAPDQDLDKALEACRAAADSMNSEPQWREKLLDPVQLVGIESLGAQEVRIRLIVRARPGAEAALAASELRRRAHAALSAAGLRAVGSREISIVPLASGQGPEPPVPAPTPQPEPPAIPGLSP